MEQNYKNFRYPLKSMKESKNKKQDQNHKNLDLFYRLFYRASKTGIRAGNKNIYKNVLIFYKTKKSGPLTTLTLTIAPTNP